MNNIGSLENTEWKRAHFIGICGVGMSAVAKLLIECGWLITGSDEGFYAPISMFLDNLGIQCLTPHKPENIPSNLDLIVIGKHAKLLPEINSEVYRAFECGIPVKSYPEVLQELTKKTKNIIVAGSFGKSTITALLSWILHYTDQDPSYFIGAIPKNLISSAKIGKGTVFILEGDEYPSSNWDLKSKFLYYNPNYVLLTSCEHDHLNVFPTYESYLNPFLDLVKTLPSNGLLLYCYDNFNTDIVVKGTHANVVKYSTRETSGADWSAKNLYYHDHISFDLVKKDKTVCQLYSPLFGLHNLQNIVGASALLLELGLVNPKQLEGAIREFQGIKRRLDLITKDTTIPIYEDIASSRSKARATLKSLRSRHKRQRIIVVFEPYSLSFRHRDAIGWYYDIFENVDVVLLATPRKLGAYSSEELFPQDISRAIMSRNKTDVHICSYDDIIKYFQSHLQYSDVVIIMSSGGISEIVEEVKRIIIKYFPITIRDNIT